MAHGMRVVEEGKDGFEAETGIMEVMVVGFVGFDKKGDVILWMVERLPMAQSAELEEEVAHSKLVGVGREVVVQGKHTIVAAVVEGAVKVKGGVEGQDRLRYSVTQVRQSFPGK